MSQKNRQIFRGKAASYYMQSKNQNILPKYISPRIFILYWSILGLSCIALILMWAIDIPLSISGEGVILHANRDASSQHLEAIGIALPSKYLLQVRAGQKIQLHIDTQPSTSTRMATIIKPTIIDAHQLEAQYHVTKSEMPLLAEHYLILFVHSEPDVAVEKKAGDHLAVSIQTGSLRMLSWFIHLL